jgi:phytol kinase
VNPWLVIAGVLALLALSMALLAAALRLGARAEVARKLLHVEMGLVTLGFPWWFADAWPVLLLAGGAVAWFVAVRISHALAARFGAALRSPSRHSLGEVWFVFGVCFAFLLSAGDPVAYCIAILVLTLADTAAALVGQRFGNPRRVPGGSKSLAGCGAFLAVAFSLVVLVLTAGQGAALADALRVALIVGVATTVLEALLAKGLDNLFVPLGALAALRVAA